MKSFLPEHFQFAHKYSVQLNEQLRNLVAYGVANKLYSVRIDIKDDEKKKEFSHLQSTEIASWLKNHGYTNELEKLWLITLYPALVTDLYLFVDEALICSEKARLTLTYALLRKPLRDNLFYLEWLLVSPQNFVNTFDEKDPSEFSLDQMLRQDKVRGIIREAIDRIGKSGVIDSDVIFNMRYEPHGGQYSLHAMWNRALHLITTRKSLATEQRNLNFIFSDDQDRLDQWTHIYTHVPAVLDYAVNIAEALLFLLSGSKPADFLVSKFHRELGFAVWSKDIVSLPNNKQYFSDFPNDLDDLYVACPRCHKKIDVQQDLARALFLERYINCPHCHRYISIRSIVNQNTVKRVLSYHPIHLNSRTFAQAANFYNSAILEFF